MGLERCGSHLRDGQRADRDRLVLELDRVGAFEVGAESVECRLGGTGLDSAGFATALKSRGVLCNTTSPETIRFVTHFDVSAAQCESALGACEEVAREALASHATAAAV